MSGGVDSSVALMLLKNLGYEVHGVSLKYDTWKCSRRENVCCSAESFKLAKFFCDHFDAPHKIIDVSSLFKHEVIDYFTSELKNNRTPSPCIMCNPRVKFLSLINYADEIGAQFVATGHYARVQRRKIFQKDQLVLMRGKDLKKDQSYSLSFLTQAQLGRIIFPNGDLTKDKIYSFAKQDEVLNVYSVIKQSQDFCFLNTKDYPAFLEQEVGLSKGRIIATDGKVIGEHEGLNLYTIGQRKGIGLAGGPYYVVSKQKPNTLTVSKNKKDLLSYSSILRPYNLIITPKSMTLDVKVKSRSSEEPKRAKLHIKEKFLELAFPQSTQLVPGQVAVFYYQDNICLGGGVICSVMAR